MDKLAEEFTVRADDGAVVLRLNRAQAAALAETLRVNVDDDTVRYDNDEPERADLIRDLATALDDIKPIPVVFSVPVCRHGCVADGQACLSGCTQAQRWTDRDGSVWTEHTDGLLHHRASDTASWGTKRKIADKFGPLTPVEV